MNPMGQKFAKQTEEFFHAAENARMPESVQAMAEDGVAKSRAAYTMMASAAKDASKAMEEVASVTQNGARQIGEQVFANVSMNTEAAFKAAEMMARSRTLPEAAKVQAEFMQAQMAKATEQTREFYELSARVAKEAFESFSTVAQKSFEQVRKAG